MRLDVFVNEWAQVCLKYRFIVILFFTYLFKTQCRMCERKPWTQQEDKVLRELKEVRCVSKWSQISQIMSSEFQIFGRNGKQCRQRYHNHLDSRISKKVWVEEEEKALVSLHNEWGNRWAAIARQLPGRTDNCVKNHFYSYFRRAIKKINNIIGTQFKKSLRPIKLELINKIVSIIEAYHKDSVSFDRYLYEEARIIKNDILKYEQKSVTEKFEFQQLQSLTKKIGNLNKICRKTFKKKKEKLQSDDEEVQLKKNRRIPTKEMLPAQIQQEQDESRLEKFEDNANESIEISEINSQEKVYFAETKKMQSIEKNNKDLKVQNEKADTEQRLEIIETPEKQQKNICISIINSVDFLEVKNKSFYNDLIQADEEKQWNYYLS